ncbi:MAG: hypothetical protein SPI72_05530 [Porphyromonas sp.]|nr:hypothetical protein [Porphyromonas sp.]
MKDYPFLYQVGAIALFVGAVLHLFALSLAPWVYAIGATLYTLYFLLQPHKKFPTRKRRLLRLNLIAGLLFISSAVFLFRSSTMWILFFALAMVFATYSSLMFVFAKKL